MSDVTWEALAEFFAKVAKMPLPENAPDPRSWTRMAFNEARHYAIEASAIERAGAVESAPSSDPVQGRQPGYRSEPPTPPAAQGADPVSIINDAIEMLGSTDPVISREEIRGRLIFAAASFHRRPLASPPTQEVEAGRDFRDRCRQQMQVILSGSDNVMNALASAKDRVESKVAIAKAIRSLDALLTERADLIDKLAARVGELEAEISGVHKPAFTEMKRRSGEAEAALAAERERAEKAENANRTRPDYDLRCGDCGRAHILDTSIPSAIWNKVAADASILCTTCIDDRMAKHGVEGEAEFYFVGKALKSKLYDESHGCIAAAEARATEALRVVEAARVIMQDFVAKVDAGNARSTRTYAACKDWLTALAAIQGEGKTGG